MLRFVTRIHVENAVRIRSTQSDEATAIYHDLRAGIVEDFGCFVKFDADRVRTTVECDEPSFRDRRNDGARRTTSRGAITNDVGRGGRVHGLSFGWD